MGIQLGKAEVVPELVYNRVFLTELTIKQPVSLRDDVPPRYTVFLSYRMYAVTPEGERRMGRVVSDIEMEDYLAEAMAKMEAGNPAMLQAFQAIEGAVAAIIADDLATTATIV